MAPTSLYFCKTVLLFYIIHRCLRIHANDDAFSITQFDTELFHGDYTPPSPSLPPLPPHLPSLSCEDDLKGIGSLNTYCQLNTSLDFSNDVYIEGNGSLSILPGVILSCQKLGCIMLLNMSKEFVLGRNAMIIAGSVTVDALNASLHDGSVVNVSALAGEPPSQTSGAPPGEQGDGGGYGGIGASCVKDNTKLPDDVWGGDAYSWLTLIKPYDYGSKGGTTSKEEKYGGEGGGRIWLWIRCAVEVTGSLLADGGEGGTKGGGGSGGSIYVRACRM